jgi:hypothetical protein
VSATQPLLPYREIEHRAGQLARGWLLPTGGLITCPAQRPGSANPRRYFEAQRLPQRWIDRALVFKVNAAGEYLTLEGKPLTPVQSCAIDRETILAFAEARYVREGYAHAGWLTVNPPHEANQAGIRQEGYRNALRSLVESGAMRRRACLEVMFDLPAPHQVALIEQRNLHGAWEERGKAFYPHHPDYGEIPAVFQAASEEREGQLNFALRVRRPRDPAKDPEMLALTLTWEPRPGRPFALTIAWQPTTKTAGIEPGQRAIDAAVAQSTSKVVRSALAREIERCIYVRYRDAIALDGLCDWLAGACTDWLAQAAAPLSH